MNPSALERLVGPGMPLAEAKAILGGARFEPWEEEPYRAAQARWLDRCTELSDVVEPDAQHSCWIDLSSHPDPDALAAQLVRSLAPFCDRAAVGLSSVKWIARAISYREAPLGDPMADSIRNHHAVSHPGEVIAPWKTRFLEPIERAHRERLEFLGYPTIGDVADLPVDVLRGQFGDDGVRIRICARGGGSEPVLARYPLDAISDRIHFESPIEDLQMHDQAIREIGTRLGRRLEEEDRQSKHLRVILELEGGEPREYRRTFAKPIHHVASAISALRLLLSSPPDKPLFALRVCLDQVTQTKRLQRELEGRTTRQDREIGARAAFQHVRTVFGDVAIRTGEEIVEPRRKLVLRAWSDAVGWR